MKAKHSILAAFALLCLSSAAAWATDKAFQRRRIDLDGTWSFCIDPDRRGETDRWFDSPGAWEVSPSKGGRIEVPGIWDAQGYGAPTDKVRHNFVGCGWYCREFVVPADWPCKQSVFLVLTGISRYAKVWIDGTLIGPEAIGCIGSHEWNITPFVKPGRKSKLVVCVDSKQRWDVDPLLGTAQLNDFVEVAWGGLWGHVFIESRPKIRLGDIYLRTSLGYSQTGEVGETNCGVRATIVNEKTRQSVAGERVAGTITLEILTPEGTLAARAVKDIQLDLAQDSAQVDLWAEVPKARLWTPDTPYLYNVRVKFTTTDGMSDILTHRYGMREILFAGNKVLLNGKPLYLRGYGDDHIYPEQFSMPTDINLYRQRLRAIKAFGFNHCRHHSIVMPHEYYDACDELGMLPSPEMLIAYSPQLPGVGSLWKKNVAPDTSPEAADNTIVERLRAVVHEYRNHPSILAWVGGNEMGLERAAWDQSSLRTRCYEAAKQEDPDRPFMDCDGDWLKDYVAQGGRDTEDCYSILFDEWCNPITNPDKYESPRPFDKPTVAHEMGNFLTFSRPSEIVLFERTNFFPFWMQQGWNDLRRLQLDGEVEDWALASEQLYLTSYKYTIESARRNGSLSGYHLWQINDYWTSSNGLFDHFFRPKSIKPEDFLPFNSAVAILQRGLRFLYTEGDTATCSLQISNYGPSPLQGRLSAALLVNGKAISEQHWENVKVDCGSSLPLKGIGASLPIKGGGGTPRRAEVRLSLQTADSLYTNAWTTYIFPRKITPETSWPIYADDASCGYFPAQWEVHSLEELSGEYPAQAVYVVAEADDRIRRAVHRGAGLILFDEGKLLPSLPLEYKQSWWKAGDSETKNNTGTYVYPDSMVDDVVDHSYCGPAWAPLVDGGRKYNLEAAEQRPEVIVRALSSIVRVRDVAVLFQFGYGQGRVVADGLNHRGQAGYPLSQWLLARMADRVASSAKMRVEWNEIKPNN
ncbi:MAG: hypothetical protein K5945_08915 [Bacteroidaceae bacterium]|nr:hypothetical protein [Bacteroidaceae bacterium]